MLREFENVLKIDDATGIRAPEIDLFRLETGEDDHLRACARYGYVKTAVAAFAIKRRDLSSYAPQCQIPRGNSLRPAKPLLLNDIGRWVFRCAVTMPPPAFDDDPRFLQCVENLAVEQFVAKLEFIVGIGRFFKRSTT